MSVHHTLHTVLTFLETTHMQNLMVRFVREEEGQDLIEYVLLGSFIALVVLGGATALGTQLNTWYNNVATWVGTQATKGPLGS
jgi:pilus assembly protein Flp/PilA